MLITPGKTYIGTVRATGRCGDPLTLRAHLDRLLAAADLHPHGLPMQAIVCIRKLRSPLPGCWQAQTGRVRTALDWQRAIATTLDQLLRHAAHPGQGVVPEHAEAVIFADYSDMLASLASDWCRGEATTHWWWRSILRGRDLPSTVLRAWRESPEYVPAALQRLTEREQAVSFVAKLPTGEALIWVQGITRRFALPELQAALELTDQPRSGGGDALLTTDRGWQFPSSFADIPPLDAPWQPWIQESTGSSLSLEQKFLLGIGLMLQRAPAVVRSSAFVLAVQRWRQAGQRAEEDGSRPLTVGRALHEATNEEPGSVFVAAPAPATALGPQSPAAPAVNRAQQASIVARMTAASEPGHVRATIPEANRPAQPGMERSLRNDAPRPTEPEGVIAAAPELQRQREDASEAAVQGHMRLHRQEPSAAQPPADGGELQSLEIADLQIDTDLGGLFFLINVGLSLNLYGDFTTPAEPGIALPIWDFVALLGQELVGEEVYVDPAWGLLAHLSGRDEQVPPGTDFEPPDTWRLPAQWLAPFHEKAIWHWQVTEGRLQVRHPAQFLVLDIPLEADDPARQLRCALQDYGTDLTVEPQPEALAANVVSITSLGRWLGWLMPYVRARLQRAVQALEADELAQIVCRHHARVFVTATHVNILMALDALPIEIRLAGLDRNPGWVPAAGRFMAFHFA